MKNLLLLTISTFPRDLKEENEFKAPDGTIIEHCISQLEPIAKWALNKWPSEEPLEIIALCTKKTLEERRDGYSYSGSYDFFCKRICEYLDTSICEGEPVPEYSDEPAPVTQKTADNRVYFTCIPVNEDNITPCLRKTADYIRIWKKDNPEGKFLIDNHGGFRDLSLMIQGIISLLRVDGIHAEDFDIYGVKYTPGDGGSNSGNSYLKEIVNQRDAYDMFEFVSGMNDFIHFGSAEVLRSYYKKHQHKSDKAGSVLDAINKVSEGTQFCDASLYMTGLNELAVALPFLKDSDDTILGMFYDYLNRSFGELMDPNRRTYLGIIKWSKDNGLYQQALTMIESYMPDELVEKRIFVYKKDDSDYTDYTDKAVFEGYMMHQCDLDKIKVPGAKKQRNMEIAKIEYLIDYICQREKISPWETTQVKMYTGKKIEFSVAINNRYEKRRIAISTDLPKGNRWRSKAELLLWMHRMIKNILNCFNHSNPERPDMDKIKDLISLYIETARELYEAMDDKAETAI